MEPSSRSLSMKDSATVATTDSKVSTRGVYTNTTEAATQHAAAPTTMLLTSTDFEETLAKLYTSYQATLQEKQLGMMAQMRSLRQTTALAIAFMIVLLTVGTKIVIVTCNVPLVQALLFSVYTVTSAGFGSVPVPRTTDFLVFGVVFVYLGISALAINVAQVYQYLETEHQRWIYRKNKAALATEGLQELQRLEQLAQHEDEATSSLTEIDIRTRKGLHVALQQVTTSKKGQKRLQKIQGFASSAWFAPIFLISILLVLTFGLMILEGFSFMVALYIATFAMTTVGYGDIVPTTNAGTWFIIFMLPFNVPFVAIYLGTVAHYWVRVTRWKQQRIEQRLRMHAANLTDSGKKADAGSTAGHRRDKSQDKDGEGVVNEMNTRRNELSGNNSTGYVRSVIGSLISSDSSAQARGRKVLDSSEIMAGSSSSTTPTEGQAPKVQDKTVDAQHSSGASSRNKNDDYSSSGSGKSSIFMTVPANSVGDTPVASITNLEAATSVPSKSRSLNNFAQQARAKFSDTQIEGLDDVVTVRDLMKLLKQTGAPEVMGKDVETNMKVRFAALERLARIVVSIVNAPSTVEIKHNEFLITIESFKETAVNWMIPYVAREQFRVSAFQSLFFVGESELASRGMDAFLDMDPFYFNSLLGPAVAAMGKETEAWLKATEALELEVDVNKANRVGERRALKNQIEDYFPVNPGNAVLIQM